jgi:hypothetical protein
MKNFKVILYTIVLSTFFMVGKTFALDDPFNLWQSNDDPFWVDAINEGLAWTGSTLDVAVQWYAAYLLWFLYLLAVLYWIYWWFLIFTAWDKDDQVKKWRNVIMYALLWVVVIFLAGPITNWVLDIIGS